LDNFHPAGFAGDQYFEIAVGRKWI